MRRCFVVLFCLLSCFGAFSQNWESVKADNTLIWGEGWGSSVDEADQQALSSLVSKITIAVVNDFQQVEQQVLSSQGNEHYLMQSNRSSAYSNVTLSNTHRVVLKSGRKSHVGR